MKATNVGHYVLGRTIGEGTFGKVKLGTHILTQEKVAVKILEKARIADVADVHRVAREIHILKIVHHSHVVQLYEIIETPDQLYLIMEYCSGGELFDHIVANGRIEEHEVCRFLHQIVAGIEQLHRLGVVHRDLKPENLLLDEHSDIKVVDFGLSNTFKEGQLLKTACGSPCYAAPEMIAGQHYAPAPCDMWSCGVILFALACGFLPFEDPSTTVLYSRILQAHYEVPDHASDGFCSILQGLLTTDPAARYTVPLVREHPWYQQIPEASRSFLGGPRQGEPFQIDDEVLLQMKDLDLPIEYAAKCLRMRKHNHVTTTYHLLASRKRRSLDSEVCEAERSFQRAADHEARVQDATQAWGWSAPKVPPPLPIAAMRVEAGAGERRPPSSVRGSPSPSRTRSRAAGIPQTPQSARTGGPPRVRDSPQAAPVGSARGPVRRRVPSVAVAHAAAAGSPVRTPARTPAWATPLRAGTAPGTAVSSPRAAAPRARNGWGAPTGGATAVQSRVRSVEPLAPRTGLRVSAVPRAGGAPASARKSQHGPYGEAFTAGSPGGETARSPRGSPRAGSRAVEKVAPGRPQVLKVQQAAYGS